VLRTGRVTLRDPAEDEVLATVRGAIRAGSGEVWIEHQDGPVLAVVIGGSRAMVMRLAEAGDAGFHAVDPEAPPEPSEQYVLANGQVDEYTDRDTIAVRHVLPVVRHFLATLERWPEVTWEDDAP